MSKTTSSKNKNMVNHIYSEIHKKFMNIVMYIGHLLMDKLNTAQQEVKRNYVNWAVSYQTNESRVWRGDNSEYGFLGN